MSARRWMWVTVAASLVLGMSLGVLLDRFALSPGGLLARDSAEHRSRSERFLAMLAEELDLTAEQRGELERVLAANREKARAYWAESRREFDSLRERFRHDIRSLLSPDQRSRFDDLMEREDARRRKRRSEKQP